MHDKKQPDVKQWFFDTSREMWTVDELPEVLLEEYWNTLLNKQLAANAMQGGKKRSMKTGRKNRKSTRKGRKSRKSRKSRRRH